MAGSIIGIYQELFIFLNPVIHQNAIHRRNALFPLSSMVVILFT